MLGAWPCGTIVFLGELFGSESKSQVYAFLHAFLQQNENSTKDISKHYDYIPTYVASYLIVLVEIYLSDMYKLWITSCC